MSLWINGEWIKGQGARREKTNPVSHDVLWQGFDADSRRPRQAPSRGGLPGRARRFPRLGAPAL